MAGKKQGNVVLPLHTALLPVGSRVAVAVSGGADSTALLLALRERAAELGLGVLAAHLHHGIRGAEAEADREFLRALCARLGVRLIEAEADVPAAASADGETLEEAARHARLRFFARLLREGEADVVVTAHTEDDQAETVMMKLMRGAWTEGLGGIAPVLEVDAAGVPVGGGGGASGVNLGAKRGAGSGVVGHVARAAGYVARPVGDVARDVGGVTRIVGCVARPLLGASRAQVVAFLEERGEAWREDSTNLSAAHTRNRVRAQLMPLLREFNPSIAATLSATATLAREEEARWAGEMARLYTQLAVAGRPVRGGGRSVGTGVEAGTVSFEIDKLRALDLPTRRRLLRLAAARMGVALTAAETLRVMHLAGLAPADAPPDPTVPSKPNSRLPLREGLRAERSVRELRLSRGE